MIADYTIARLTIPKLTLKVLNFAIFEIIDHFREIFTREKFQNHKPRN